MVEKVRNYIRNQESHHKRQTSQEEYDEFILKYGFQKFKGWKFRLKPIRFLFLDHQLKLEGTDLTPAPPDMRVLGQYAPINIAFH